MPAIDPERLSQDVQRLMGMLGEPPAFTAAVLEQLECYADRARRSRLTDELAAGERAFNVRPPVLRALSREFTRAARQRPKVSLRAADRLWEAGWRESRILAISMLKAVPQTSAADRVERWAQATEDRRVLSELAESGLAGLRQASPAAFLRSVRAWLRAGRERPRLLALLALQAAANDPDYQDLPGLLRSLRGVAGSVRAESRRALRELLRALAERSPAEAASYLLAEFKHQQQALAPLIQQTLPAFPARQQAVLKDCLSAHRRAGIMRPS